MILSVGDQRDTCIEFEIWQKSAKADPICDSCYEMLLPLIQPLLYFADICTTAKQNPSFIPVEPWQVGAAAFGSQAPNPAGWDVSAGTSYQYWPITFCVHFVGDVWPMMFGII